MNPPTDLNSFIKERKDVLLGIYQENRTHARHHEGQISKAANIMILATLGLVTVIANDSTLNLKDWPLTCSLILIGVYGTIFTTYHFERICRCKNLANRYRQALDDLLFKNEGQNPQTLEKLHRLNDGEHDEKYPSTLGLRFVSKVRVLWPLTISLIGIITTVHVLVRWR
jgi:hypothetical protein